MITWKCPPQSLLPILSAGLTLSLFAADKTDLTRIVPVPAGEPIPLADFFRPHLLQEPRLNPAGTHIAAIVTAAEDRHQLLVYELKTQKFEMVGGVGDKDIYEVHWLNDQRLVFGLAARKMYGLGLMAAKVGALNDCYPLLQYYSTSLIAVPPQNRLRPLVWNRYDGLDTQRELGAAVINTELQAGKLINLLSAGADHSIAMDARDNNEKHIVERYPLPGSGLGFRYLADKAGRLEFGLTALDGKLTLHQWDEGRWEKCPVDLEHIDVVDCGDQPGELAVIGPRQEGQPRALQLMQARSGQLGEVILQDKAYDFAGWLYRHPVTHAIIGAVYDRNGPQVAWFNEDYRNLQKMLDGFFPGLVVRIIGSNEAEKLFLVATYSDRQPAIYNWVDMETHQVGLIKPTAPWIDAKRMQPVNILKFKTRDGRQLDAYVTLPAGASKQHPVPLVVLPHGGPWVRDTWGYDGEAQFLASRGYAVMKPNYRGSTGSGWMFPEEDQWDFRKMHDDVTDATKTIIATGLVDAGRIAIMGGSFGGYLALSGVVNEPGLYRCAVSIAGVFDWEQLIQSQKFNQFDNPTYGRMLRKLGDPKQRPEKFAAIAPVRRVDQIRVPVFVSHGKDDPVSDISQSRRLIGELEKYHVPHDSLLVSEEGHGMGHLENQLELYGRIEAFLAKNLLPVKAAGATSP